jgi:tetratricopeptide (TPR) repeat protein
LKTGQYIPYLWTAKYMQQLYSGKDIDVYFDDQGGNTCFVTFTSLGNHKNGFAQNLLEKRNKSAIYFISRWNHWWLSPEMAPQLAMVREILARHSFRQTVGYGASMGGFGVALHGHALALDTAVMIAPQFSIDARKVPFERRWRAEAAKVDFSFDDVAQNLSPIIRYVIVLDEASADAAHADLFAQHIKPERINIIGGGHTPGLLLRETGQLTEFFFNIVEDRFSYPQMRKLFRERRRRSAIYFSELSLRLVRRRSTVARTLNEHAVALAPRNPVYALQGANLALADRDVTRAEALAFRTIRLVPDHPGPWRTLSRIATVRKNRDAAVEAAKRAVECRQGDMDLQRVLMEALFETGQYDECRIAAEKILKTIPDHAATWQRLAQLEARAGNLEATSIAQENIARVTASR